VFAVSPLSHRYACAAVLALSAAASAQLAPSPARETRAVALAAAERAPEFLELLHDRGEDGALWIRGTSYKASFDASGAAFVPFLGSQAPRNFPVRFALREVRVGARTLALDAAAEAQLRGTRVEIERGLVTEQYLLALDSIEQRFVIAERAGAGELEIEIELATELASRALDAGGFAFENEHGGVRYGRAEAFDARGERVAVAAQIEAGRLVLRVPAEFVDRASYPLTVDPLITAITVGSATIPGASSVAWMNPDVAYEAGTTHYVVAMEHAFSATDHDIYVQAVDTSGVLLGGRGTIDFTSASWVAPRIASDRSTSRFLVVAQRTLSGGATVVAGRIVPAALPLTPQIVFTISGSEGGRRPDVGGDPSSFGPTYFCVCWEGGSSGFSNIYYNLVRPDGTLAFPVSALLGFAPTVTFDTRPSMSKSNGGPGADQAWAIAWQRRSTRGDQDVFGALVRFDGTIVEPNLAIDDTPASTTAPCVSSPTADLGGPRKWMVVFQETQGTPPFGIVHEDLRAVVYYGTGPQPIAQIPSHLSSIFPNWAANHDEVNPCVDTDGCRFVVGFTEFASPFAADQGTPHLVTLHTDYDVAVSLTEVPVALNANPGIDDHLQVTSIYSGGGEAYSYFATFDSVVAANTSYVEGALWQGVSANASNGPFGYFNYALPGCGGVALQASGFPALGGIVGITMTGAQGLTFILIGFSIPPIELCSGCWLGVDPFTAVAVQGDVLSLGVPCQGELVNQLIAFQGIDFSFAAGCPGAPGISLSDEIIVTIL
jgi:hypothetical protein